MKSKRFVAMVILAAGVTCGAAQAKSILVDSWTETATLTASTSVTGLTLAGEPVSFAPGTQNPQPIVVGTLDGYTEYAWGAEVLTAGLVNAPSEQVVIDPISSNTFSIEFAYNVGSTGGADETASLTVDGTTYTAIDPAALTVTNSQFLGAPDGSTNFQGTAILTFVNGSLVDSASYLGSWTGGDIGGGTVSAPEIDPSSAVSALTLLAGSLAVLSSSRRRRTLGV